MIPIPYWWLASFLCCAGLCQAPNERAKEEDLEPIQSALTYHTPDYHLKLREVLLSKAPHSPPVQFLALPSFQPETLLTVYETKAGTKSWNRIKRAKFEAQVVRPCAQIWEHRATSDEVKSTVAKRLVPREIAERVTRLWRVMLLRTRHSTDRTTHLDGVSYYFSSWEKGLGTWSGEANNPARGSRPYALAGIGKSLIAFVEASPEAEKEALSRVTAQMDALDALLADADDRAQKARRQGRDDESGRKPEHPAAQPAAADERPKERSQPSAIYVRRAVSKEIT